MTFRLTDDFAELVCDCLGRAYKYMEDSLLRERITVKHIKRLTDIAMVKTVSEMFKDCIGNDKPEIKENKKVAAIKSV